MFTEREAIGLKTDLTSTSGLLNASECFQFNIHTNKKEGST